nr:trans-resveratrol di-O-methyltransferase-like [Ipomoea batatas]
MALQDEIVRAETHIRNHILNFINTCSLKCAVELGIPDVIHKHGGPITLEELVDALAINKAKANHLGRLMRLLTRSGFFVDANDGEVFEGLDSLVDVGGGIGKVAKAFADEFPDMKYTVFDLPHVVAGLEGTKNLVYVGGNMFEVIPPAQAVFLKSITHNWNDEDCVKILKKCKEAIPNRENGGKVIILDMIVGSTQSSDDDEQLIQTQIFANLQMMVHFDGRERTLEEWVKIFNDASFTDYKITELGLMSLIQLFS